MVALTPRFAALGAFVYLASLSAAPLSVGAVAIRKPPSNQYKAQRAIGPLVRSAFRLAQLKARKRDHDLIDIDLEPLFDLEIGIPKRRHEQHHFHARHHHHHHRIVIPTNHGRSYYMSPSSKHGKRTVNAKGYGVLQRDASGGRGRVDLMSSDSRFPSGKKLASLWENPDRSGILSASENNATQMYLVNAPSPSRAQAETPNNADSEGVPVMLQVHKPSGVFCTTYNVKESTPEPLTLEECTFLQPNEEKDSTKRQVFDYDSGTGVVRPFWIKPDHTSSSGNAQSVLERADASNAQNVTLVFVSDVRQVANVEDTTMSSTANAVTSTMTTTVTVTSAAATAPVSAADAVITSSAESSPASSVPALTSTTDASAPTASSAGALDVQVVGPASSSTSMFTSTSAAPTTTINAQDVASSIAASSSTPALTTDAASTSAPAASSSTPALTTDAASTSAPAASSSSMAAPTAAAVDASASTSSGTDSSVAPTMTPFSTEPYKWKFRRE